MFFVYDAFGCVLRILVIRLTLFLLIHPLVGYSISLHSKAHSIELFILNPSINLCLCDHSIVSPFWNHSIASDIMPATTRSMSKRMIVSDRNQSSDTLVHCDETFIDESVLSSSSLDTGPCHSVISNFQNLELSKFQTSSFTSSHNNQLSSYKVGSFQNHTMESDCEENRLGQLKTEVSSTSNEILTMLSAISSQMMVGHQDLQQQNSLLSAELQKVIADTDNFKKEMRDELSRLQQHTVSLSSTPMVSNIQSSSFASPIATVKSSSVISSQDTAGNVSVSPSFAGGTSNPLDFQAQMLTLLNNTFAQLTTVITETKTAIGESKHSDSKSEWSKFSGDTRKFRHWYLGIMSQISISPWTEMYDASNNNVVKTTTNSVLNGKLYAKVIAALEGQPFQHMVARPHLRGNGILLLQELHQMYNLVAFRK
jgi:hypothetical protein